MASVPKTTHEITEQWLTEVLTSAGQLNTEITDVRLQPIGEGVGLMGELGRLHLTYKGEENLPNTIVAKCAAQNENREVAKLLDFYTREADFYNKIASDCPMRIPASYHADVEPENYDFVLLMEDLGDVSPRDQLVGASEDEVYSAIEAIAQLHAKWWGATQATHPWMYDMMSVAESERLRSLLYVPAMQPSIDNFPDLFTPEMEKIVRAVGENFVEVWANNTTPVNTFVHGDYRQDNMLYTQGRTDALVMDWQISGRGKPIFDVTYFMCQSVSSDLRAEIEQKVIEFYVGKLADAGIEYDQTRCFEDYRRMILGCLVYPMTVCGTLDTANERGRALGECMMSRNFTAIQDLGCASLLAI
jgi:hypothetical protein